MSKGLKTIACFKALRGSLALIAGVNLIIIHQTSEALNWSQYPILSTISSKDLLFQQSINWLLTFSKQQILVAGFLATFLGLLRWAEAIGIWSNRSWAQFTAVATGMIFLLVTAKEISSRFSWLILTVGAANVLILVYLLYVLHQKKGG